jgi:hypothetical protein
VLCLERGGKAPPNTLRLRVCLVTGNDTALKTNPKAPGTRGVVVECEMPASCTVTSLRDLAGALLLSRTPGWTDPPPLPPVPVLSVPVEDSSGDPFQKVNSRRGKDTRAPPPAAPVPPSTNGGRGGGKSATRAPVTPPPPPQPMRFDTLGGLITVKPPRLSSSSSDTAFSSSGADDLCEEKRLRRTNAFEECGDLLDETEAAHAAHGWRGKKSHGPVPEAAQTGGSSTKPSGAKGEGWKDRESNPSASEEELPITLEAAGLRSGDLLLFEDGPLPVGGRAKLMVYLWVKDVAMLNATPTALSPAALPDQPVNGQKEKEKAREAEAEPQGSSRRRDGRFRDGKAKGKPDAPKKAEERAATIVPVPAVVLLAPVTLETVTTSRKQSAPKTVNTQATKTAQAEPSVDEKEKAKVKEAAVDEKEDEEDDEPNALASALKQRSRHLLPLFVSSPLCLPEESTLLQLQKAILTGLQGEAVGAALRTVYPTWKGEHSSSC